MSDWLARVLTEEPGFEAEVVARYSERLLAFARRELPVLVRSRVDPEDVVQSVYRSFFQRLRRGEFAFQESHDLWRLLAAMTFHKTRNAVKYHLRDRRDPRRERPLARDDDQGDIPEPTPKAGDLDVLVKALDQLLGTLPQSRRDIVVLRLEGKSVQEIARQVGCSRQTVYRILGHVQEIASQLLEKP